MLFIVTKMFIVHQTKPDRLGERVRPNELNEKKEEEKNREFFCLCHTSFIYYIHTYMHLYHLLYNNMH